VAFAAGILTSVDDVAGWRIVESGTYEELMEKQGVFYHMESLQMSTVKNNKA
jgi:hypothetical protein